MSRTVRKSTMKITSRKRKTRQTLNIKTIKFDRTLKRMRAAANRLLKKEFKGETTIKQSVYNKVDRLVSKEVVGVLETVITSVKEVPKKTSTTPTSTTPKKTRRKSTKMATKKSKKTA